MNKLSSVALTAAFVVAGVGASVSAEAHPYFSVRGAAAEIGVNVTRPLFLATMTVVKGTA